MEVCESLRKLTSAKAERMWNATYPKMFEEAKAIIKDDVCMKFYNDTKLLYIETDVSRVGLEATLLQTRDNMSCHTDEVPHNSILRPITFASKSLTRAEKRYSNIETEALDILYGFEKFHHYCFAMELGIITEQKPLVTIFKKDVATLS